VNSSGAASLHHEAFKDKVPWMTIVFLTAVFFLTQHDWYFSLNAENYFGASLNDFTESVDQGSTFRRIAFLSLGLFALLNQVCRKKRFQFRLKGLLAWSIIIFLSWASLSLTWSVDPGISCRRLLLLAILCLGAFAAAQIFSLHNLVLYVFITSLCYLHLGLAAEIVLGTFHPLSEGYRFAGTLHPNSQAVNCALLVLSSYCLAKEGKGWRWFFLAVVLEALIFLVFTKSRTSLGFALLAPMLYSFSALPLARKGAVILSLLFTSCLLVLFSSVLFPTLENAITLGRDDSDTITLTGRVPLWSEMLDYIARRPVQGYGYDSFWTSQHVADIASEQGWVVTQGHSAYLDLTLGLGIFGSVLYFLIMAGGIKKTSIQYGKTGGVVHKFFGIVLTYFMLLGLLESIPFMANHTTFLCMILLSTYAFSSTELTRISKKGYRDGKN